MSNRDNMHPHIDYDALRAKFDWAQLHADLDWLPDGGLNMAHEAIDRHAVGPLKDRVALLWEGRDGRREQHTFAQIKEETDRFVNVLKSLGIEPGDRIGVLMEPLPELFYAFFGTLKAGAVAVPLSAGLSADAVKTRVLETGVRVLVTQPHLRDGITGIVPELFHLDHILVVNKYGIDPYPPLPGDLSFEEEMSKAPMEAADADTSQYDDALIVYTSGTAGRPKPIVHCHYSVVQQLATGRWWLDLRPDDVFWCMADPGSPMGAAYGALAPWANGNTQLVYDGQASPGAWYQALQDHHVSVWLTTPDDIARLMDAGEHLPRSYDLSALRFAASGGSALAPKAGLWGGDALGRQFHDGWLQAETGTTLIANHAGSDIKPGSIGTPTPGVEIAVLDDGFEPGPPGREGHLAVRPGWPSMFRSYWQDARSYGSRFRKGWYITGDRALKDEDGYLWFRGRAR